MTAAEFQARLIARIPAEDWRRLAEDDPCLVISRWNRETLLSIAFAMGVGFAILENMVILVGSVDNVSIIWAFMRGFGAARMHSACTSLVGNGISYIHKRRKLFYCGTFSLLIFASISHGLFNMLIQSEHRWAAYIVIVSMYVPQLWSLFKKLFSWKKDG